MSAGFLNTGSTHAATTSRDRVQRSSAYSSFKPTSAAKLCISPSRWQTPPAAAGGTWEQPISKTELARRGSALCCLETVTQTGQMLNVQPFVKS